MGRAPMAAAESWAVARGHRLLTPNVFDANERARRLYDRLGYEPDTSRLVEQLRTPSASPPVPESPSGAD